MEIDHEPPSSNADSTNAVISAVNSSSSPSSSSSSSPSISSPSSPKEKASELNASTSAKFDDDDEEEEEEDVCRICRNPGDAENPLRYPCACSGSIKFVHQDCLLQWLNHSNARQCEVCSDFDLSLFVDHVVFIAIYQAVLLSWCLCVL